MSCRLLKAAGVAGVPSLTASTGAKEFIEDKESWWNQYTDCIKFSKRAQQSRRRFHFQVQTDGISVSVLMFQPFPEAPTQKNTSTATATPPPGRKRKRQQQISRAATVEWVKCLPDRHVVQPARIVGLDPGRKALFTAVVHSQQAADSLQEQRPCQQKYESLSWSCSRWQEAAGIKYRLHKTDLWMSRKPGLDAALLATPTAKVASSALFLLHIRHRMQHTAAAQTHFGDKRHRQLRWRSFTKRQQAYSAICKESVEAAVTLLWLMEMQSSAAAAARGTPAHLQCHCGGSLGTAVRYMTLTSSAQASFAVPARQPWMACLSLF